MSALTEKPEVVATVLMTVLVPTPITREQLDNLFITAFEGGINYWCTLVGIKDNDYKGGKTAAEVVSRNGVLKLFYLEDESDQRSRTSKELTLAGVVAAIPKVLAKTGKTWEAFYDNHDANDADMFVQFALFGELVYG